MAGYAGANKNQPHARHETLAIAARIIRAERRRNCRQANDQCRARRDLLIAVGGLSMF